MTETKIMQLTFTILWVDRAIAETMSWNQTWAGAREWAPKCQRTCPECGHVCRGGGDTWGHQARGQRVERDTEGDLGGHPVHWPRSGDHAGVALHHQVDSETVRDVPDVLSDVPHCLVFKDQIATFAKAQELIYIWYNIICINCNSLWTKIDETSEIYFYFSSIQSNQICNGTDDGTEYVRVQGMFGSQRTTRRSWWAFTRSQRSASPPVTSSLC